MLSTDLKNLDARAVAAAKRFKSTHRELLDIIMEVDGAKVWQAMRYSSTFRYCVERLELSEDVACSLIAIARKAKDVPELKEAVDDGLDISKAKIVARVITPENQEEVLKKANTSTCAELEKEAVKINPKAAVVEQVKPVAEDRYKLTLGLSEETLQKFRRSQDLVCNKRKQAVSFEEALEVLLDQFLAKEDPVKKAERAPAPEGAINITGANMPASSIHAVNLRDRGKCRVPGCDSTRWIDIHHIIQRSEGGTHHPDNLITLCGFHHREHHRNHPPRGQYCSASGGS